MTSALTVKHILLIDDDADDYMVFEDALKELDDTLQVSFINSAKNITGSEGCLVPDIIFLDINMPDKNGFEWLNEIRTAGYTTPVIMYSTASNPSFVQRAYEQGANIYFPKPESFRKLKESLKQLLSFNWNDPDKVKAKFCNNGEYNVFSLS